MTTLLTIIGARPQIIKAAALSRAVAARGGIVEHLLHTGQHYDSNMSQVFFDELGIPSPTYNLGVGSGSHGVQTARMIEGIENVLATHGYDGVVVYGDTNSTLAGAVAASKLHIPVYHIEAGLRSFNMAMPEEVNRIVADQLATMLFAPTQRAVDNLRAEGFFGSPATFADGRKRQVLNCGDVMYDNSIYFAKLSEQRSTLLRQIGVAPGTYALATIHRPQNTDDTAAFASIMQALIDISEQSHLYVLLPLHPRTASRLDTLPAELLQRVKNSPWLRIMPPASYLDMIALERHAQVVLTDSGGVQKESFFFQRPCVILRPETEWVEIVERGAGILAGSDTQRITKAFADLAGHSIEFPPIYGDGHAAEHILEAICG